MPSEGAEARSQQLGTVARLNHELARDESSASGSPARRNHARGVDGDIARLARRDWERARRVPDALAAELASAGAEGQQRWQEARAADDFSMFAPALERNVTLAREYGAWSPTTAHALRGAARRLRLRRADRRPAAPVRRRSRTACWRWWTRRTVLAAAHPAGTRSGTAGRRRQHARAAWSRCRRLAGGRLGASLHCLDRAGRHPHHDPLQRRRRRVAAELAARVRPRAVRATDRPGPDQDQPRPRNLDVRARVPEQAVGEPRRPQRRLRRAAGGRAGGGRLPDRARASCTRAWPGCSAR